MKYFVVMTVLLLVLFLAGCQGDVVPAESTGPDAATLAQAELFNQQAAEFES